VFFDVRETGRATARAAIFRNLAGPERRRPMSGSKQSSMVRKVARFTRVVLFLVLSQMMLAPAGAAYGQANPPPLDHFPCYPLLEGPQPDVLAIQLQDQFDIFLGLALPANADLLTYLVGQPTRFCNPVEKTVVQRDGTLVTTPISDPDAHLTLYRIFRQAVSAPALLAVPAVTWRVRVRNQFGEQKVEATRPVALAVPTLKLEAGLQFPEDLDHFKCYEARGNSVRRQLEDQFEAARVAVLSPRLFCNPRPIAAIRGTAMTMTTTIRAKTIRRRAAIDERFAETA
jgi:hypothetical protein